MNLKDSDYYFAGIASLKYYRERFRSLFFYYYSPNSFAVSMIFYIFAL